MNELYYIRLLKDRLRNYREKSPEVIQCSCPVCGDSRVDHWKARFYFLYDKKDFSYYVNCHNCNYANSLKWFLRAEFPDVFKQYVTEEFLSKKKEKPTLEQLQSKTSSVDMGKLQGIVSLKKYATPLKDVEDKDVIDYCKERNFTENHYNKLYYTDNFGQFNKDMGADKKYHKGNEGRIIIPFFKDGKLIGWQGRSIGGNERIKYIIVSLGIDDNLLYGVDDINEAKWILVTEGALDSLFLDNCIAVNGLNKFDNEYTQQRKNNVILVLDNEKRNKQVSKEVKKLIDKGYRIYYNKGNLKGKDINDYFTLNDISKEYMMQDILDNNEQGLLAKLNYVKYLNS